jgi:hypothetical protein
MQYLYYKLIPEIIEAASIISAYTNCIMHILVHMYAITYCLAIFVIIFIDFFFFFILRAKEGWPIPQPEQKKKKNK